MASAYPSHPEGSGPGAIPGSTGTVLTLSGTIPPWLQFTPAGSGGNSGMATLTGTPPPGSQGTYNVTLRAANQVSPDAIQSFAIDVVPPGAMTYEQFIQGSGGSGLANQGAAVAISPDGQTAVVGGPGDGAIWIFSGPNTTFGNGISWPDGRLCRDFGRRQHRGHRRLHSAPLLGLREKRRQLDAVGGGDFGHGNRRSRGGHWLRAAEFHESPGGRSGENRFQEFIPLGGGVFTTGSNGDPSGVIGSAEAGASLSLSPDGNTVIMGGPGDNTNAGAAWILTRDASGWTSGAKLTGAGAVGAARFGTSVALSGDGNTAVVGGPADNSNAGAVWVFTRSGAGWTPQGGKLTANDATGPAQFGSSVAVSTDGHILAAGGPMDNSGGGATWFYIRNTGVWSQAGGKQVALRGVPSNARQGTSVALSGSGNIALTGGPQYFLGTGATWGWRTPDLTVSLIHNGTFLPGQTGSYTVSVTNSGTDYTQPGFSWNVALPVNLTPAGISAPAGWSCVALGCTATTDFLPPGGSVQFTLAVNVTGTGSATATATVSGKELNTTNDTASDTTVIGKATPVLTWNAPAPITYGSALGATQLNAAANVPGIFVYTPPGRDSPPRRQQPGAQRQLHSQRHRELHRRERQHGHQRPRRDRHGWRHGGETGLTQSFARGAGNSVVMTLAVANTGGTAAQNVTLTAAKIGTTSGSQFPSRWGPSMPGRLHKQPSRSPRRSAPAEPPAC